MEKKRKSKLPIKMLYLAFHNQLKKKYGINNIITRKEIFVKLGRHSQIPKNKLRCIVINEMEEMNLIKKEGRDHVKILNYDIDIESEKDRNKLFKLAGIY